MKKDSPIAPKNPRSAQKAEETEISSPEVEILDAPPSRKRAAPAGGGTRGGAAKTRARATEGKAAKQSILDVDGSAVREVPADSVSDDQDDDDAIADSAEDVDVELDASDHDLDPIVLEDDHEGLPAPSTTRLPAVGPRDSLHLYLREVSRFPLLKPDEEHELALRVRDHNDADAAFRLVSSHLRLVVRIAMDFQRRWMQNVLDLVQEGNVGLMRAVNKFDPDKGIKFSYYASFWIKAYILKFIMDNWRMVKIGTTQVQRKLFYNLNRERQKLIMQGFDPDAAMLSERLGVTEDQINEMDQRLASTDMSLNVPVGEDAGGATRMDFLPALGPGIEDSLASDEIAGLVRSKLKTILPKLNEKELYILQNRLLTDEPVTLREIGERYNVTRERVRQLEARLLEKIRQHLAVDIKDFSDTWIQS
ncbi:RNA polymerase factor sigma-32 [Desulfovibrio sp. QI0442]